MALVLFYVSYFLIKKDKDLFIDEFCDEIKINKNQKVVDRLNFHIHNKNTVFLISGTPEIFIKKIYKDVLSHQNVILIGSNIIFDFHSMSLKQRCISKNKLIILDKRMGKPIYFCEGYSELDIAVLKRCHKKFFVSKAGDLLACDLDF